MNVKVLGTLSPYPKNDKNCIGYLVYDDKTNILVDCGNGSSRYLSFPQDLNNLTIIITHLHPDHYADIFGIINAYNIYKKFGLISSELNIILPFAVRTENDKDYYDYMNLKAYQNNNVHIIDVNEGEEIYSGAFTINFKKTCHNIACNAVKINDGYVSIGYTSDTGNRSIHELATFFKDVNLLISEATFLNVDNTESEYHLHAQEGALMAQEANCDQLILTHLWPEHNKEEYIEEARQVFDNVIAPDEGFVLKIKALN